MKILEVLTRQRRIGNRGEKIAAKPLKKSGYRILCKNYVAFDNEIDIIAEDKTTVAFIEVKTRTVGRESANEPRPASAVTPEKQRKIIHAAKCFLAGYKKERRASLDVIEVYLNADGTPNKTLHIKNAFNINTAYNGRIKT
jgi:putative endonuclease